MEAEMVRRAPLYERLEVFAAIVGIGRQLSIRISDRNGMAAAARS